MIERKKKKNAQRKIYERGMESDRERNLEQNKQCSTFLQTNELFP